MATADPTNPARASDPTDARAGGAPPLPPARASATFRRLVRYVRPHLWILAAAIVCAGAHAGARAGRAWLLQPLFDDIIMPAGAAGQLDIGGWLAPVLPGGGGDEAGDAPSAGVEAAPDAPGPAGDSGAPVALDAAERERIAHEVGAALPRVLLAAFLIVTILPLAHLGQLYLSEYVLGRVLVDVQQDLCAKLLHLPLSFHHQSSRGDVLSRVTNDAQRAHSALDLLLVDVVQAALAFLVGGVILLVISWQLTLALLLVAPAIALLIGGFGRRIRKSAKSRQESQGELTSRLVQILGGIKVIKAFGAEDDEAAAFSRGNRRLFRRGMRVVRGRAAARTVIEGLNNAVGVAVILLGALAVVQGLWGLTIGALGAYVLVMQSTYRPVKDMSKGWTRLMEALPSAERFFELLDTEEEAADAPDALDLERVRRGLRLEHVSFHYGREPVLQDVSLDVRHGEVVAIVGRTGAGKTTLVDLLLRFHEPAAGRIEVDGIDLRRIRRSAWLRHVAVVTQEPFLFPGSIRENVRYGRPEASDAEVDAAVEAAHVAEFAAGLPDGLHTDVGDAGVRLSGGQRQRITIARAILRDPDVLVLDEATSALDARSERFVQEALDALLEDRTVFVIAHRLSTIRRADKIVVLEKGRIAELGTHAELVRRDGGLYRELVELQASA